jgi:hypothetical protein
MLLTTPNSELKDFLQMRYDSFPDFKNFIEKVKLSVSLNESKLSLIDLNYFAKNKMDKIKHNIFNISGTIQGKVKNIKGKDLKFTTGSNTMYEGNIAMTGLPNIKETVISADIKNLKTNAIDIKRIYPNFTYPPQLQKLGNVTYRGEFDGFVSDFVSNGYITTAIGNAQTDINVKKRKWSQIK